VEETVRLGRRLGERLGPGSVVLFSAGLGAGKTTFTKGIALGLGIEETLTSPTYTIISEYHGRLDLYHIDLYRINDPDELENLGLRDILGGGGVSVVEWSGKLEASGLVDENVIRIAIHGAGEAGRVFEIEMPGGGESAL
jgi:tRNA threonylcarbamoyladenosine biosynthesis protein TsaE